MRFRRLMRELALATRYGKTLMALTRQVVQRGDSAFGAPCSICCKPRVATMPPGHYRLLEQLLGRDPRSLNGVCHCDDDVALWA